MKNKASEADQESDLRDAFKIFDRDNNGYIEGRSKDELLMWARKFVVDDAVWRGIFILPTSRCGWQRTIKRGVGVCEAKTLKQYETPFWAKYLSS